MSSFDKAAKRRSRAAGGGCPAWCVFDHERTGQPAIVLHESPPAVIGISEPRDADVPEWFDVRTTQYSPEEPGEPPGPPAVELSCHQGSRYRVTTLTADEARHLAASLFTAATHAVEDPHPGDRHAARAPEGAAPRALRPHTRDRRDRIPPPALTT
jgi:hypothetical protein